MKTEAQKALGEILRTDPAAAAEFDLSLASDAEFRNTVSMCLDNPGWAVRNLASVRGGDKQGLMAYDEYAISYRLQHDVIEAWSDPPRDAGGYTLWNTILGPRQIGKSAVVELVAYALTSRRPGHDHVCDADTKDRAKILHSAVHHCHKRWPEQLRTKSVTNKESSQLTLEFPDGTTSRLRVRSANDESLGLGESPDSYHASEVGFWNDFGDAMSTITPSIANRMDVRVLLECTPVPLSLPSGRDWRDHYIAAKNPQYGSRHRAKFYPFWDSKLNTRRWERDYRLTNDELRLLERYGPQGLTKENLAFMRTQLEQVTNFKKHPELFRIWYPFDDVTCWIDGSVRAIPATVMERHDSAVRKQWSLESSYQEYEPPEPGTIYVIGADPCGSAGRDHAAFVVLSIWHGSWSVVAAYSDVTSPSEFARLLMEVGARYNDALIAVESNGVGQGTLSPMVSARYRGLLYDKGKPGIANTGGAPGEKLLGDMTTALMTTIEPIPSQFLYDQLITYKNDKQVQESNTTEVLRTHRELAPRPAAGRREKHHWDLVSALIMAVQAAQRAPHRFRPRAVEGLSPSDPTTHAYAAGMDKGLTATLDRIMQGKGFQKQESSWRKSRTRPAKRR